MKKDRLHPSVTVANAYVFVQQAAADRDRILRERGQETPAIEPEYRSADPLP